MLAGRGWARRAAIITDAEVGPLYAAAAQRALSQAGLDSFVATMPAGEAVSDFRSAILALKDPIDPESQFMIAWYASTAPVDAEFLRRQRRDAAAIPVRVWLAILDQGLNLRDVQADLQRIRAPTQLIWGGKDNLFGARDRCSLRSALPQAEVRLFGDLGHNAYWEDPRAIASVINPFLAAK